MVFQLYMSVMASHPGDLEAGDSRSQAENIVSAMVPQQELLDAQIELALARIEHEGPPDVRRILVRPLVSKLSALHR